MIKYEDECCGCATPGYPCLGKSCPNKYVRHYYCDDCGYETNLYWFDDEQLCIDCIQNRLEEVVPNE